MDWMMEDGYWKLNEKAQHREQSLDIWTCREADHLKKIPSILCYVLPSVELLGLAPPYFEPGPTTPCFQTRLMPLPVRSQPHSMGSKAHDATKIRVDVFA